MSIAQALRDCPIFIELQPQSNGTICFQLVARGARRYGASLYAAGDDSEFYVRAAALDIGRFPNNRRLYEFVLAHAHGTIRGRGNPSFAYRLAPELLAEAIGIIREGMGSGKAPS